MDPATEMNKNIQWAHGLPLMLFYIFIILIARFALGLVVGVSMSWTLTNVSHAIVRVGERCRDQWTRCAVGNKRTGRVLDNGPVRGWREVGGARR